MEIGPIWRALSKNRAGFILIGLQIAVTMAIMVNAVAIMQERTREMGRPSGMDEANIFTLRSTGFVPDMDMRSLIEEDLHAIRSVPGVVDATASNSFPLRQGGSAMSFQVEPGQGEETTGAATYRTDEHALASFGLELVDGSNFAPNEVNWRPEDSNQWPGTVIVSEAFARAIFPGESGSPLGKTIYVEETQPLEIVGIVRTLQAPWKGWDEVEHAMLVPQRSDGRFQNYVIRTEPGMRDALMPQIETMLAESNRNRLIQSVRTMDEVRARSYMADEAMIKMLAFIVTLLIVITGLGIVGLASFNVSRRTRQIGIRRALGATRGEIVRHFQVENFLVTTLGILVGAMLAVALNMAMVNAFALTPLSWYLVPAAMLVLWLVGQAAVIGPAQRASRVSPAIATRSG